MALSRRDFVLASGGIGFFPVSHWSAALPEPEAVSERMRPVSLEADVVVAGGGLAGVCAAIAAARQGASVVLLQDRSRLGGNSSSEIRMHVCGANHTKDLAAWRETGLIEEFKLTEAATNPQRSFHIWDLVLYDKVVSEPNITLMLDTALVGAEVREGKITAVRAVSPQLEEQYEISAAFFVDCTGDGALAAAAGARCMRGREGQAEYGESLAPEQGDQKTMGSSLLFFARKHERAMPFAPPPWARKFTEEDFKHRPIRSWEYGYWWIEWGGDLDTIADQRRIRHELLRILLGVWDHIKNSGKHPESEAWALDFVGMLPGKRESRRIVGEHVLVQSELERAELFPDRVAYGGWPMDDHPPGGMDARGLPPCQQIHFKRPYSVPLRSLYSVDRPNLMMAGRNISASHVALTSTRVMATCSTLGQAAGTAAAFCAREKMLPRALVGDAPAMKRFQQMLLKDDQSLLGVTNEDPLDLARQAAVTASAETYEGPARSVIDGWNRHPGEGVSHQWQAPMESGEPWLELRWPVPKPLALVQITFDTGLHRGLFLSGQDSAYLPQIRQPQPETVAAYTLEAWCDGAWKTLAEETNNVLRLVRHRFEPVDTEALRIRVRRTHGDPLARVFEVRCYGA